MFSHWIYVFLYELSFENSVIVQIFRNEHLLLRFNNGIGEQMQKKSLPDFPTSLWLMVRAVVLRAHVFGKGAGPPTKGFLKKFHCTVDFMEIEVMPPRNS